MPSQTVLPSSWAVVFASLLTLNACSGSDGSLPPSLDAASNSPKTVSMTRTLLVPIAGGVSTIATAGSSETPLASDALADSVGLNAHMPDLVGAVDFSTLVSLVRQLKVRHLREGILPYDAAYDTAMNTMLDATGADVDGITDCASLDPNPESPTSPAGIRQFDMAIGNRMVAVEGPNEVDQRGDTNWPSDTKGCIGSLRGAEPTLPFYAPSIADQLDDAPLLGNISAAVDDGNMHRYFSGRNPGSAGWGGQSACGAYGALAWAMCETQINSGNKPIVVTETGYDSIDEVDELTQAKYLSRLFFVNLKAGISRSYVYDLRDYQGDFGGNGLLRIDDTPKPAYAAIAAEIGLFADSGAAPLVRQPVTYAVTAQSSSVQHALFEKNDGSYVLAIWNETMSWDPNQHREIVVAPQTVAIAFASPPQKATAQAIGDAGTLAPAIVTTSGNALNVAVDDHMTFVSFRL